MCLIAPNNLNIKLIKTENATGRLICLIILKFRCYKTDKHRKRWGSAVLWCILNTEAWTKWPSFFRGHNQMHFLTENFTVKPLDASYPKTSCLVLFLVLSCSCLCLMYWSHVLSRKWRCSWSSTNRWCANYIRVIKNCIAHWGASILEILQ